MGDPIGERVREVETILESHVSADKELHTEIRTSLAALTKVADRSYGAFYILSGLLAIAISLLLSAHPKISFAPSTAQASTHAP